MKSKKPKKDEARTETIMIRVRPSVKRMAVAMAKADDRSLSSFISILIEAEEKLSHFRRGL
jgi:predicted HicB family RNase H-like nuclease